MNPVALCWNVAVIDRERKESIYSYSTYVYILGRNDIIDDTSRWKEDRKRGG